MSPTTTDDLLTLDELRVQYARAARELYGLSDEPAVVFEAPRRPEFGDVATNLAFNLAKAVRQAPAAIATAVAARAMDDPRVRATVVDSAPAAGFINLRLAPAFWQRTVAEILRRGADFGRGTPRGERISLEFGSANPTGPLVVVQGRTLSIGDTLAKALRFAGYDVFTEWIINDAGSQIDTLGRSLYARYRQVWEPDFALPDDGYPGEYLIPLAHALRERDGDRWRTQPESVWLPEFRRFGRDSLVAEQRAVAARFGVAYDLWQSETEMNERGAIEAGLERLRALGITYEQDGATWVRTTDFGDDIDRVVIRSDGRPTYYAADVAYFYEKFARGNDRAAIILGPDHHGYIGRLRALASAYGHPGGIEVIIAQQITLVRGDQILSMSKRAGTIVTLTDIIDDVGVDAARFFFVRLSTDQPLTFDLELAKAQTSDNPVYYVQYGHARIASLVRRAHERDPALAAEAAAAPPLERLANDAELGLMRRLADFPGVVEGVARARAPHRLPAFARDIAADFHAFYDTSPVLPVVESDRPLAVARLALAIAAQTVLAQTLALCGVSAPERMERSDPALPAER